jgi:para-nitrobenzyl esterase
MTPVLALLGSMMMAITSADDLPTTKRTAATTTTVRTPTSELRLDTGLIRGLVVGDNKDVHVYKGIPFAAPPVGERRWKAPEPTSAWQGVRDCFEFGAACPQKLPPLFGSIPEMAIRAPFSEDCLFLNVWAPATRKTEKLPVLYWIHGGGYVMGAASQPLYDGEELARLGCVVVSVNYRLGLFGFLAHPALSAESTERVSGNYGLLDQIEGLRWVKRNIAAFGGDPDRVTIFGESAGGMSVLCLMTAPQAKGLFDGAVTQSPAWMNMVRLRDAYPGQESAEQAGQRLMTACGLGMSADTKQMRELSTKAILDGTPAGPRPGAPLRLKPLALALAPIVDGHVIPDNPNALFAVGRQHPVPMIAGNTSEEMSLFLMGTKLPPDEADYLKKLKENFGDLADSVAKAYAATNAEQIRRAVVQLSSDLTFVGETRHVARAHATAGQKTYRYQFSRGTKRGFLQNLGAHHAAELAFLFQRPAARDDAAEMRISRAMGRYWVNFAASGNPNGDGLPPWPAYRSDSEEMIDFTDNVNVLRGHRNEQLDLVEKILRAAEMPAAKADVKQGR